MTIRRRKAADGPTPAKTRARLRRQPAVWLATLSTVVGVATGMFTLRDQVFPREAGTAAAVPVSVYEQRVARICDQLNNDDRRRAREWKTTKTQLQRATTPISQRNALLDSTHRIVARSAHALAAFTALEAPEALAATRKDTAAAWNRHVASLRGYALRLDRAGTPAELHAANKHLSTLRPRLARDRDRYISGLQRLGAANCDLRPPVILPSFTLPPLRTQASNSGDPSTPDTTNRESDSAETAQTTNGGGNASATTPATGHHGSEVSVTPPESDDPGSDVSVTPPESDPGNDVSVTPPEATPSPDESGSTTPNTGATTTPDTGGEDDVGGDSTGAATDDQP